MKKTGLKYCLLAAMLFTACGDSGSSASDAQTKDGIAVVSNVSELPECTQENEGEQAYIRGESSPRICVDKKWFATLENGSVGELSCSTEKLKDNTGLKIICNGDSVGVVLNGANGKGEDCAVSSQTDSTVTITCGNNSTTLDLGNRNKKDGIAELDSEKIATPLDSLDGYTQKGPFVRGSTVYLYELESGRTLKQTNGNFTSNIISNDGRYRFLARDLVSQYAMLVVDGNYRNEVTGKVSTNAIRLKAFTDLSKHTSANVNLLTHLEYERVYYLVTKMKKKVYEAKHQAQAEILGQFYIKLKDNTDAEEMNVFGSTDADAALLAISILLQGDRSEPELMALLAEISDEIAESGKWEGPRADSIKASIAIWAMINHGNMKTYRDNVENWGLGNVPPFERYVDNFISKSLGFNDECTQENAGKEIVVKSKYSPYNGKTYACTNGNWIEVHAEKTHFNPNIRYGEMIDPRDHKVYKTVDIGAQTWMAENLDYADTITYPALKQKSWCYEGNPENCSKLGRLYAWSVTMDSLAIFSENAKDCGYGKICSAVYPTRGICPEGWHIPLADEWRILYGIDSSATAWVAKNYDEYPEATDKYGLSVLRAGYFNVERFNAYQSSFWSADDDRPEGSGTRESYEFRIAFPHSTYTPANKAENPTYQSKDRGYSIRCLKDKEIAYGQLKDPRDGQVYKTVEIAGKTWMAQNLNYRYVANDESADSSSFCFNNIADSCTTLGRLYKWSAAMDLEGILSDEGSQGTAFSAEGHVRGVCPKGWHLPTKEDLENLLKAHGWSTTAMIAKGITVNSSYSNWVFASNVFGFSILNSSNNRGCLYTSTEENETWAYMTCISPQSYYYPATVTSSSKNDAYSVRCIQD